MKTTSLKKHIRNFCMALCFLHLLWLVFFIQDYVLEVLKSRAAMTLSAYFVLIGVLLDLALLIYLFVFLFKRVLLPVERAAKISVAYAQGDFHEEIGEPISDEVGKVMQSLGDISARIKHASVFAEKIGKGELEYQFSSNGSADVLGNALIEMRNRLLLISEEDKQRNWTSQGLTKFADVLRANSERLSDFGFNIISELVKYVNANQGSIFILNDNDKADVHLDLVGFYAYEKRKYVEKKIKVGQGLVGQCFLEGEKILLTAVPEGYIQIRSGLGDASPTCVLIMPLKVNAEIFGVIEIASFQVLKPVEIDFFEKVSESIAATFKALKVNLETARLLAESRQMQLMMGEQEEELRQNTEEIKAQSEQMQSEISLREAKINKTEAELSVRLGILNEMCLVSETDQKGNIVSVNEKFAKIAKYTMGELQGKPHNIVRHPDMPAEIFKLMWATIGSGNTFRGIVKNKAKDGTPYWVDAVITPIKGADGKPSGYMGVRYDITEQIQRSEEYTYTLDGKSWTIPTKK